MIIHSVQHRGLLRLIEDDDTRELRTDLVKRLRNILAMLISAPDMNAVLRWFLEGSFGGAAPNSDQSLSGF
jgi:plasmid maintenance system killer protein